MMADTPSDVPIQPVPMTWGVGIAKASDSSQFVLLRISTPTGAAHYFLDGKTASKLAGSLGQNARQVMNWEATFKPGIVIPNGEGGFG